MNGNDMTASVVSMMLAKRQGVPTEIQNAALIRGMVKDKTASLIMEDRGYKRIGDLARDNAALRLRVAELEAKPKTFIGGITGSSAPPTNAGVTVTPKSGLDLDHVLKIQYVIYYGLMIIALLFRSNSVGRMLVKNISDGFENLRDAMGNIVSSSSGGAKPSKGQLDNLSAALKSLSDAVAALAASVENIPPADDDDAGVGDADPVE